jgi:protein ImuB
MVVCVHFPRFELIVAAGGAEALVARAVAIAPSPGCEPRVGEVSGAAEACGITRGMAVGEALARCPELRLVAGDPLAVAQEWGRTARALEGIGAALELPRAGLAYFESDGLRGLHGGDEGVIAAARRALARPKPGDTSPREESLFRPKPSDTSPRDESPFRPKPSDTPLRDESPLRSARVGAGPTRFCALAAALEVRSRRAVVVGAGDEARRYLAAQPVALLGYRVETAALVEPLARLGVSTLGELAALGSDAVADRFGAPGVLARRLARGEDDPLRARPTEERLEETLEFGEANSGPALERVLGVLVDRLLARAERRGRTLRSMVLSARLVEGGTWRERVVLREALSDPRRLHLALAPRLTSLPAPAAAVRLEVERFGPPEGEQGALFEQHSARPALRRAQVREAVAQVRAAAGPEAAVRALCVDPDSRVPERRVVFTPFPG